MLRPKETLQRLCDHLGVTCSEDYFEKCSKILYGAPSVTGNKVVRTNEQKMRVTNMMKKYPFLKEYSFAEYPRQSVFFFFHTTNSFDSVDYNCTFTCNCQKAEDNISSPFQTSRRVSFDKLLTFLVKNPTTLFTVDHYFSVRS